MFLARRRPSSGSGGDAGALAALLLCLLSPSAARADHCGGRGVAGDVVEAPELAEVSVGGGAGWRPLRAGGHLCLDDVLRLGLGQRGVVRLRGGAFVTVAENTTLRIERAAAGEGFLLRLAAGLISVFSRRPEALEVGTPFANAAVEGTEFVVAVEADRARVTVLEGRVGFGNPRGRLSLAAGSTAVARAGEAPVIELDVRPRDAVRWALYYPPVSPDLLGDRDEATLAAPLRDALRLRREDRPGLPSRAGGDAGGGPGRDVARAPGRAGAGGGPPRRGRGGVDRALALDPGAARRWRSGRSRPWPRGRTRRRWPTLAAPWQSVPSPPRRGSPCPTPSRPPSTWTGRARRWPRRRASPRTTPWSAPGWPRSSSPRGPARGQARRRRGPPSGAGPGTDGLGRGFVALAGLDTRAAKAAFAGVIAAEPLNPQARLGQGLARVREGDLAGGREDLELAVALDPGNSLLRSYLGKAYLEERRDKLAGDELATAKGLDPNDPTPWFYDAIRKQRANRPVEALRDLEEAIGRNDRRGVYRSRLLLDRIGRAEGRAWPGFIATSGSSSSVSWRRRARWRTIPPTRPPIVSSPTCTSRARARKSPG
jgi:hypothetical protein